MNNKNPDKAARVKELAKRIEELIPKPDEMDDEEKMFEKYSAPLLEQQKELLAFMATIKEKTKGVHPQVSVLQLNGPRGIAPVNVVDFAGMKSEDVINYDGRFGGEEAYWVKKRLQEENKK